MRHATPPFIGITYASNEFDQFADWRLMFRSVIEAGGVPLAIDCGGGVEADEVRALVVRLDGLLISGGGDVDPALHGGDRTDPTLYGVNARRDAAEIAAFEAARSRGLPIMAVCRGMHLVNAHMGGTLWTDLRRDRPSEVDHRRPNSEVTLTAHEVVPVPGTLLSAWMATDVPVPVNSHHHQGVRDLAPSFSASAHAVDGLVEAMELPAQRILAIQWHPEVLWQTERHAQQLLDSFVSAAAGADGGLAPRDRLSTEGRLQPPVPL
ncbi:gamma-glutamyl-gamma-aminobutyrate hydrolase family protein [Nocardioides bigeumensis]|jgi:putative glutamine amidotransferase|uniref:Gamma-glutamyl-gamma-aminobutyrate hydrolase family protein n=1 Tax=Nocardioides bigeumensis TaxID=433657 RepID=A0ABP5JZK6_9ACTN